MLSSGASSSPSWEARWLSGSGVYICCAIANSVVRQRWPLDSMPVQGAADGTNRLQSGAELREIETRSPFVYSPSGRCFCGSHTSSASFSPVTCVPGTACALAEVDAPTMKRAAIAACASSLTAIRTIASTTGAVINDDRERSVRVGSHFGLVLSRIVGAAKGDGERVSTSCDSKLIARHPGNSLD